MTDQLGLERPPAYPLHVGKEIDLHGHRWVVKGIHLGALGQESLIHLEGLSHTPGWTGPWEFHPMLFVPEIMLSAALGGADQAREADRMREFAKHTNWELSYHYGDEDEDEAWLVHSVNGGRSDREWTVIGRGETPQAAIDQALAAQTERRA